jgi:hypothetical protein
MNGSAMADALSDIAGTRGEDAAQRVSELLEVFRASPAITSPALGDDASTLVATPVGAEPVTSDSAQRLHHHVASARKDWCLQGFAKKRSKNARARVNGGKSHPFSRSRATKRRR